MTLLLHEATRQALDRFAESPSHALLLSAPAGSGKTAIAENLAASLLQVPVDKLASHPHFVAISPPAGKTISIAAVRDIIHCTTLRTPGSGDTSRIILIEHADTMTAQAQNALLKTIEEPPAGTVLLLTAASELAILPTIRSRVQRLQIRIPGTETVRAFFEAQGYGADAISRAILISGGLPGLMQALLSTDTTHPLFVATGTAREILQKPTFERLVLADMLAGQRQLWLDVLFILGQMATTAIAQNRGDDKAHQRWQRVLAAVYDARGQTAANAQLKLVLLQFMLAL